MSPSDTKQVSGYFQPSCREGGTQIYDPCDSAGLCPGTVSPCTAGGINCPPGLPLETAGDWVDLFRRERLLRTEPEPSQKCISCYLAKAEAARAHPGSMPSLCPISCPLSHLVPAPPHPFACHLGLLCPCLSSSTWFPLMAISRPWPLRPPPVNVGQWVMDVVPTGNRGEGGDGGAPGLQPTVAA